MPHVKNVAPNLNYIPVVFVLGAKVGPRPAPLSRTWIQLEPVMAGGFPTLPLAQARAERTFFLAVKSNTYNSITRIESEI